MNRWTCAGSVLVGLCAFLAACGSTAAPASEPVPSTAPVAQATQIAPSPSPKPAATTAPTTAQTPQAKPIDDAMLQAVYAHLGRGPSQVSDKIVVEGVQGPYARVALVPDVGDGLWLFLQKSQGGWFVLTQASMTAQPDLSAAREKGVPEELLRDIAGTATSNSAPTAEASLPSDTEQPIWTRTLSLQTPSLKGDDIRLIQQRLRELGYVEVGVVDGIFGSSTAVGVRNFQSRNKLTVDGIVGEQTWNRLFSTQGVGAEPVGDSGQATDGKLTVTFDSSVAYPPSARVYLVRVDGSGYIAADMPEQPAGQPFVIAAPAGMYHVYARSRRFEDIGFFALWDAETMQSPALAQIDIQQQRTTGPLELLAPPELCNSKWALPKSPDGVFPETTTADYRQRMGCH